MFLMKPNENVWDTTIPDSVHKSTLNIANTLNKMTAMFSRLQISIVLMICVRQPRANTTEFNGSVTPIHIHDIDSKISPSLYHLLMSEI